MNENMNIVKAEDNRSTSPENFERLYNELTPGDRRMIDALSNMLLAVVVSVAQNR